MKWNIHYCNEVTIQKLYPDNLYEFPSDVIITFKSNEKTIVDDKLIKKLDTYETYQNVNYFFDSYGNMVWQ